MESILSYDEQFKIYINVVKPLVADLSIDSEKCLTARWVQKLISISDPEQSHLKLVYLKLLLHCLVRNKLLGPFTRNPPETLTCLPLNKKFSTIVEYELCEYCPCIVDLSADLLKYVAVQEMPKFGVHCYFAFSTGEKLNEWNNIKDINHLKGNHSFTKSKWVLPPLPKMKPLPDLVPGDQEVCDCDKVKALNALEKLKELDEVAALPLDHVTPIAEIIGGPHTQKEEAWEKIDSYSPKSPPGSTCLDMTQPKQDVEYTKPRSTHVMKWGLKRKYIKAPVSHEHSVEEERLEGILEASSKSAAIKSGAETNEQGKESIYNSEYFLDNPPAVDVRTSPWRDAKRKLKFSESPTPQDIEIPCQDRAKVLEETIDEPESETVQILEDVVLETPRPIYSSTPAVVRPAVDPGLTQTIRKDKPGPSRDAGLTHTVKKQRMDPTKTKIVKKATRRILGPLKPQELDFNEDITEFLDEQFPIPPQDDEEEERVLEPDTLWSERIGEWDISGVEAAEAFGWIREGRFDRRSFNTREQRTLQREFDTYLKERRARKKRLPQITDPTEPIERFPEWVRDLQARGLADERGRVIPEYHFPDPIYPPSRHPQVPATPPLFRRGTGHRDRRYRPSEFGLTEEEHWIPAEVYMRESIEPIYDPDERALARLLRNIEDSLGIIDEENITFNVLEDTIPDWERPSWPQINLQSTPIRLPHSTSTATLMEMRRTPNFLANVKVPDDMLDPYEFRDQGPEPPDLLEMSVVDGLQLPLLPPPRKKDYFDLEDLIEVPELESFQSEAGTSMFSSFEVGSLSSTLPIIPGKPLPLSDLEAFIDEKIEDISKYTIPLVESSNNSKFESTTSLEISTSLEMHLQELKAAWEHLKQNLSVQEISTAAPEGMFATTEEDISAIPIENIPAIPVEEMSRASSVNQTLPSSGLSTLKTLPNVQAHGRTFDLINSTELPPQRPLTPSSLVNSKLSNLQSTSAQTSLPVRDYLRYQSPEPVIYRPIQIPSTYVPPVYIPPENIFDESMDLVQSTKTTEDYDQSNLLSTTHSLVDSEEQMFLEDSSAEFGYKISAVDRYKDLAKRFAKIQSLRKRYLPLPSRIVEVPFSDSIPSHRLSFGGFQEQKWPQLRRFSAPGQTAWNEQQPSNINKMGSYYSPNVTGAASFNLEGIDVSLLEGIEKPSFYDVYEPTENYIDQQLKLYMDSISDHEHALKLMDILEESSMDLIADDDTEHDNIKFIDAGLQTRSDLVLDDVTMPDGGNTFDSIVSSIEEQNYAIKGSPKTKRLGLHSTPQSAKHYVPIDYELPSIIRFEDSLSRDVTRDPMLTPRPERPGDLSSSFQSRRCIERKPSRRIKRSLIRPRRIEFVEDELSSVNLRTTLEDFDNESEVYLQFDDTGVQTDMSEQHIDRMNNISYISQVTEPSYNSFKSNLSTLPTSKQNYKSKSYTVTMGNDKRPTSKPRRYSYHYVPEQKIQNYLESDYLKHQEIFLDNESMPHTENTVDNDKMIDMQMSSVTNYENISDVTMPLYDDANLALSIRSVPGIRSDSDAKGYRIPQRRVRIKSLPTQQQQSFVIKPKSLPKWNSRISQKTPPMRRRSHGMPESANHYISPENALPIKFDVSKTNIPVIQPTTPSGRMQRMDEPRRKRGKSKHVDFTLDDITLSQPDLDIPLLEDESMPRTYFMPLDNTLSLTNLPQPSIKARRVNTSFHDKMDAKRSKAAQFYRSLPDRLLDRDMNYPTCSHGIQHGPLIYSPIRRSILKPSPKYVLIDQESLPFINSLNSTGVASLTLPSDLDEDSNFISAEQPVFNEFSYSSDLDQRNDGPFITPKRPFNKRTPVCNAQTPRSRMQHSTPASAKIGGSYSFVLPSPHRYEQSRKYTSPTPDPYSTPKRSRESPTGIPRRRARRRLHMSGDTPTTFIQTLSLDPNFHIPLIEDEMPMTPIYGFHKAGRSPAKYSKTTQFSDDDYYHVVPISLPDQSGFMIESMSPIQYMGSPINQSMQNRSDFSTPSSRRDRIIDSFQDERCCVTPPLKGDTRGLMLDSISPIQFVGTPHYSPLPVRNIQRYPNSFELKRSPWHGIDSIEPDVSSIHTSRSDDSFWR